MILVLIGNGGADRIEDVDEMWAAFDALTPNLQRIVREAGINVTPIQVKELVDWCRGRGLGETEIEEGLEQYLQDITHQKYVEAGHPQLEEVRV